MDQKQLNIEPDFLLGKREKRIIILLLMVIAILLAMAVLGPGFQLHPSQLFFTILEAVLSAWLAKD